MAPLAPPDYAYAIISSFPTGTGTMQVMNFSNEASHYYKAGLQQNEEHKKSSFSQKWKQVFLRRMFIIPYRDPYFSCFQ